MFNLVLGLCWLVSQPDLPLCINLYFSLVVLGDLF